MKKKNNRISYLFLFPWFSLFFVFMFIPFLMGIYYSFFDYDFVNLKYIGFQNYIYIFKDEIFLKSITNTLIISFIVVFLVVIISLFVSSLIVKQSKRMQIASKISLYLPAVSSSTAIVTVWRWIFGPSFGLSSTICTKLGIKIIDWFGQPLSALSIVCMLILVFSLGQPIILFTSAISNVPNDYYESADMDGASKIKQFFYITIPTIVPTIIYVLITSTIALMQAFEVPMLLTSGGPQYSTTTILLMLYKTAFEFGKFGRAAAMGVILFIIVALITIFQNYFVKKG